MSKARELAALGNAYSDGALSNRNVLINGKNTVNQRGLTPATNINNNTYYVDRWKSAKSGVTANLTLSSTGLPTGFFGGNKQTITATSTATGLIGALQLVENYTDFEGQTVTFSAWVRSNHSGACLRLYTNSGAHPYVTHSGNGQWEHLTLTTTVSALASLEAQVLIFPDAVVSITSGDYIEFIGAQLELGDTATPFEHRSYGQELALCQRYFQKIGGSENNLIIGHSHTYSGGYSYGVFKYDAPMRAIPSGSVSTDAAGTWRYRYGSGLNVDNIATQVGIDQFGISQCRFFMGHGQAANTQGWIRGQSSASYVILDAEL